MKRVLKRTQQLLEPVLRLPKRDVKREPFSPLSIGIVFFSLALALFSRGQLTGYSGVLACIASLLSAGSMMAVVIEPLGRLLNRWRLRPILSIGALGTFLLAFIVGWLMGYSETIGIVAQLIFWLGIAWVFVIWLVLVSQADRNAGLIVSAIFAFIGIIYLFRENLVAFSGFWVFALGASLVAMGWWKIWDRFSL